MSDLVRPKDSRHRRIRVRPDRHGLSQSLELGWHIVTRNKIELVPVPQIHRAEIRSANARGVLQHTLEHWLQLARRGTDGFKNLRGRGLLFKRFA